MNNTQHTPGPWKAIPHDTTIEADAVEFDIDAWDPDAEESATVAFVTGHDLPEGQVPFHNARLIAAAPDLLAALESLYNAAPCAKPANSDLWEALQLTRQAIAKARGEA